MNLSWQRGLRNKYESLMILIKQSITPERIPETIVVERTSETLVTEKIEETTHAKP